MGEGAESAYSEDDEHSHSIEVIVGDVARTLGLSGVVDGVVGFVRSLATRRNAAIDGNPEPAVVVCASGNLAHLYFPRGSGRLTIPELEALHPGVLQHVIDH